MEMETMRLKEYLWHNINETITTRKNPSEADMKCLGHAVDMLKDIATIEAMEEYGEDYEHSELAYPHVYNGYSGVGRRRGRMSRTGTRYPNMDGYGEYSMNGGTMVHLQSMYENAGNERERANIQKLMDFAKNNLDNY